MNYRVGYHRLSDDSVTSYPAKSKQLAIHHAREHLDDSDIDHAWVTEDRKPIWNEWSVIADKFNNTIAEEGVDICVCGNKYWEDDACIDCGMNIASLRALDNEADAMRDERRGT